MKTSLAAALVLGSALWVSSCEFVGDLEEMGKQTEAVAAALEKEVGVRPQIGWNMTNGSLVQVTVEFPSLPRADMSLGELQGAVAYAVKSNLKKKAEHISFNLPAT